MLDNEKLRSELRLAAIEYLLARTFSLFTLGLSDEQFRQVLESYREGLSQETFGFPDPALGDHVSAEFRDAVLRLLEQVAGARMDAEQLRTLLSEPSSGKD